MALSASSAENFYTRRLLDVKRKLCVERKLAYPLEEEYFIQLQEECIGRKLSDMERDCTIQAVKIINDAFEDGKAGVTASFVTPEEFFRDVGKSDRLNDPVIMRFCYALLSWVRNAYRAGVSAV